jgi:acyl carrier protein
MEKFIENFWEILEETNKDLLSSETVFKDLNEWDSMTALMVIAMFDEKYDKKLNGKDLKDAITLNDLFKLTQ